MAVYFPTVASMMQSINQGAIFLIIPIRFLYHHHQNMGRGIVIVINWPIKELVEFMAPSSFLLFALSIIIILNLKSNCHINVRSLRDLSRNCYSP